MRQEKLQREKEEAEKNAGFLERNLEVYEAKCAELSDLLEEKKKEMSLVEGKIGELEFEKISIEDDISGYKRMCYDFKERVTRLEEDCKVVCERERRAQGRITGLLEEIKCTSKDDKLRCVELKTENGDLECAKRRAENEVEVWKKRFNELETQVSVEAQLSRNSCAEGKGLSTEASYEEEGKGDKSKQRKARPLSHLNIKAEVLDWDEMVYAYENESIYHSSFKGSEAAHVSDSDMEHESKHIQADGSSYKALSTPASGAVRPAFEGLIEISDSEDEMEPIPTESISKKDFNSTCSKQDCEENQSISEERFSLSSTAKRKWASEVVISDSDSQCDQNTVGRCKTKKMKESTWRVQREEKRSGAKQIPSDQFEVSGTSYRNPGSSIADKENKREAEDFVSDCVGESLGRITVSRYSGSGREANVVGAEYEGDGITKFLCKFRKSKGNKLNWKYEEDMLSSFEEDPLLCMRAVCALYRRHISEENSKSGSLHSDNRGFNKVDAMRGTNLAEFLMDGNREGDITKSIQELEMYSPKGLEECKRLARWYSKQLFTVYKSKEDAFFLPDCTNYQSTKQNR
ncbi:hypothetical protein IFM89_024846 [Coptis chinensis]|uniref:Uncharacterized protein n=1 Tax=Coptis chinensis TaxID=261450 RepID=A0A835LSS7_9MAGN|nr:hypothetical protein IFM89_024846 [Coptis chinensis]